jgi:hypothetical protein
MSDRRYIPAPGSSTHVCLPLVRTASNKLLEWRPVSRGLQNHTFKASGDIKVSFPASRPSRRPPTLAPKRESEAGAELKGLVETFRSSKSLIPAKDIYYSTIMLSELR